MRTRKIQIPLRLNEKEYNYLQKQVDKSCLNRESYIRALIMKHKVHPEPTEVYIQVVKLLSSAVNKIDKIATIAHMTGEVSENDISYLKLMAAKLWAAFKERDEAK